MTYQESQLQSFIKNTFDDRAFEILTLMTEIATNEQCKRDAIFSAVTGYNPFWFNKDILIEPVATPIARKKLKACFKQLDKDYELGYFDIDHNKTSKRPVGRLSGEIMAMYSIYERLVATNPKLFGWETNPYKGKSLIEPKVEEVQPTAFYFTEDELLVLLNATSEHAKSHLQEKRRKVKEGKDGSFNSAKRRIALDIHERIRSEILMTTGNRHITAL